MSLQIRETWKDELRRLCAEQRLDLAAAEAISARRCNIGVAIERGDVDRAVQAIESGRPISYVSGWLTGSQTLLMQAIERRPVHWDGMGRVIDALIARIGMMDDFERTEFIDAQDVLGRTAIYLAARAGDNATVRSLLSLGADPAIRDSAGVSAAEIEDIDPGLRALLESATVARRPRI